MVDVAADVKILNNDFEHLAHEVEDHEERIRALEKARWQMIGLVSLASAVASAGGSVIAILLK